jgi:hypothetical protein
MPYLAPPPLKLTSAEREQLTQLVSRYSTPQQIAHRFNLNLIEFLSFSQTPSDNDKAPPDEIFLTPVS